jgi:hypothetical protein
MAFAVFNKKLIGRGQSTEACDEVVDVSRPNLLGNPFPIGVGPNSSREQVIDRYRVWLAKQIRDGNEPVIRELRRLGQLDAEGRLVGLLCWCDPLPCHAHVVANAARYLARGGDR